MSQVVVGFPLCGCEQTGEKLQPKVRQRSQDCVGGSKELEDEQLAAGGDLPADVAESGLLVREVPESKGTRDKRRGMRDGT